MILGSVLNRAIKLGLSFSVLYFALFYVGQRWMAIRYNSDSAIPVLMANGMGLDFYDLYYWGQDRFGAWPFLMLRFVHRVTGLFWTPERLLAVQTMWISAAIGLVAMMSGGFFYFAMATGACLFLSNPGIGRYFFDLGLPFAWQILPLVGSWYVFRQWVTNGGSKWYAMAVLLGLLATWISPVSWPLFWIVGAIEVWAFQRIRGSFLKGIFVPLFPALLAAVLERLIHHLARHSQYKDFIVGTNSELVWGGHYFRNLTMMVRGYQAESFWWPISFLGVLALPILLFAFARKKNEWEGELRGQFVMFFASSAVGIACLVMFASFKHWEESHFSQRYLCLSQFFLCYGSCIGLCMGVAQISKKNVRTVWILPFVLLSALSAGKQQTEEGRQFYAKTKRFSLELETLAPSSLLAGGYWNSYLYIPFQTHHPLMPVILDGNHVRTPWFQNTIPGEKTLVLAAGSIELPSKPLAINGKVLDCRRPIAGEKLPEFMLCNLLD